jgi:hypothetical protein
VQLAAAGKRRARDSTACVYLARKATVICFGRLTEGRCGDERASGSRSEKDGVMHEEQRQAHPGRALPQLNAFLELSRIFRSFFGGDFELGVVMVTIATRGLPPAAADPIRHGQISPQPSPPPANNGRFHTNIRSIAASTNIPVETVRRKVNRLIELGWVARDGNLLCVSPRGAHDFQEVQREIQDLTSACSHPARPMRRLG